MRRDHAVGRDAVAITTALCLGLSPGAPLLASPPGSQAPSGQVAGSPKPTSTPAPKAAPSPAPSPAPAGAATKPPATPTIDGGWPRAYSTPSSGRILVYQPQVASWTDQRHMVAYAAVGYEAKGATKPALGSLKLEADTKVSTAERLVNFSDLSITESNFPTLEKEQMREVVTEIDKGFPKADRVIALDRVLASVDRSQITPKNVEGIKADPPTIFYSSSPALLVNLDGDPIWSPIKENDLKFVVNTNWDLFEHGPTKTLYLRNEGSWLKAAAIEGPWTPAGTLPDSFKKLPADDNWKDVKAALPGQKVDPKKAPKVFVSTTPAEMILVSGPPLYQSIADTKLLWVSNTESDVFRMGATGPVYFLVSGRWFTAPDFIGPWTFATPSLPADFQQIPLEHPRSRVLASVPGTQQAAEAVLLAQVPQSARINKKELKAPEVVYQGDPKFEKIEKTTVEQAVNTDKQIIKVGDLYYMCFQGVWFMSKTATGPWEVTSKVPKEIYEIPVELVRPQRHLRDGGGRRRRRVGDVRHGGCLHRRDGRVGLRGLGHRLLLSTLLGLWGDVPLLLSPLPDLRLRRLLQPLDRRLPPGGCRLWAVRRGRGQRALQPAHRHLLAWGRGLGALRGARIRRGLQPAHRRLRADAPGLERLRELGEHFGAARRPMGPDEPVYQPGHRHHDANDADGRRRSGGHPQPRRRRKRIRRRADGQRRRVRGPGRQRLPE